MSTDLTPEQVLRSSGVRHVVRRRRGMDVRSAASVIPLKPTFIPSPTIEAEAFETLTPDQCASQAARGYVVKGLIAPGDVALMIGQPGCGKSLLAPYIGYGVAQGEEMLGRRVKKAPVLYIAAEASETLPPRIAALRKQYGEAPDFHLVRCAIDLYTEDSAETCIRRIITTANKISAGMVFIDTLAAAFPGLRENDSDDMGRAIQVFRRIARETGAAVLVTHHTPKEGVTPRGHGSLNGDADVVMQISGTENSVRSVNLSKNRSGPSGDAGISFKVEVVKLGVDEDGDPITVPRAVEGDPETIRNKGATSLPVQAKAALGYLNDLLAQSGNRLPVGPMFPPHPELQCVPFEDWRLLCANRSLSASNEKRAVNQAFQRATETLITRRFIATGDHQGVKLVWVAKGQEQGEQAGTI